AALAWVDVEEFAGDDDDAFLERGVEEGMAVVEAARKRVDRSPDVERALRLYVDGDAQLAQATKQKVALLPEGSGDGGRFCARVLGRKELDRRPLHGLRAAAVEETARTGDGIDDLARSDGPGDAPAGVTPILREAIEQDDGIGIHALYVL